MTAAEGLLGTVVQERRLSRDVGRARSRFTLARDEALLRLRGAEWSPHAAHAGARAWIWTLPLLRLATLVSETASVRVLASTEEEATVVRLCFATPNASLDDLDLSGVLYAALEPDRESGGHAARARRLLGRAMNAALATEPRWVELRTPVGSRRWEHASRIPGAGGPLDPYAERLVAERAEKETLEVAMAMPRTRWGRALGALLSRSDPVDELDGLWHRALMGADPGEHVRRGLSLVPRWPEDVIELGTHARWSRGAADAPAEVWLVRDGVLVASLGTALAGRGLDPAAVRGFIACPMLGLTVDEGEVVDDEAFDALVAWLFDALAHAGDDGTIHWPAKDADERPALRTIGGVEVSLDALSKRPDVLFVWRHRAGEVPNALHDRVLGLWPSEHRWLRECLETVRLVPLHALGRTPGARPADLTELVESSFPPVPIEVSPFVEGDLQWPLQVRVHVSRRGPPNQGTAIVLAYGRRVGFLADPGTVIGGVSVVIELQDAEANLRIDVLQEDVHVLRRLVAHVVEAVRARGDALVERVIESVGPEEAWTVPYVQAVATSTTAWSLGLRYVEDAGMLALRWEPSPLLGLVVGESVEGGPCTLGDALMRARDVGGVVTAEAGRRWKTLESDDERHRPWFLTERGHGLVERTLGPEAIWSMPVVPEGQPHVAPVARQPALRLDASEITRLRTRAATEPRARALLVAGALAAIDEGARAPEIEELPLLRHFDPRAITPGRLVSLATVREMASRPGLAPVGAVTRTLDAPVLEVPPGLAALLAEVEGFEAARLGARRPGGIVLGETAPLPERRGERREEPLVTVAIVDRLAAGALTLEREPRREGVTLWARGLRVGTFRLPSPLRSVTGRLWLTDAGIVAGHAGIHALAATHGRTLVRAAVAARLLTPPGSASRQAIEVFLRMCEEAVAAGRDRAGVAEVLGEATPGQQAAAQRRLPQALGRGLFVVVRHALEQPAMLETALLSGHAARLVDPHAWPWQLRLGRRHPWIRRALRSDADVADVRIAACLVVAEANRQANAGPGRLTRALLRLLVGALHRAS